MASRRHRDPARFDNLDHEAVEAVKDLQKTLTPEMSEAEEKEIILQRIAGITRKQVALACEYLLSENLSTIPENNTPAVEHVIAMARATQFDAIVNMLGRYVLDDDLEVFESSMHFPVRRLELERDQRKAAKKKQAKKKIAKKKPKKKK